MLGSRHYVQRPVRPLANTVLMVNLEILGVGSTRKVNVMRLSMLPDALRSALDEAAKAVGLEYIDGGDKYLKKGDQRAFFLAKVPILCMHREGTHPDYHKPTDTPDKIDTQWMQSMGRMVWLLLNRYANEPHPLLPSAR